jgi:hypothetical protein
MNRHVIFVMVLCVAVVASMAGCASSPGGRPVAWNISITKKTTASIEVDLVGVANKNEENFLNGLSSEDYWKPDSQIRKDAEKLGNKLTKFLQVDQPWIVQRTDPQWQAWLNRGVFELYIIARLPEASGDWKVVLPVGKKAWDAKHHTLEIVVVDSGVSVQTKAKE